MCTAAKNFGFIAGQIGAKDATQREEWRKEGLQQLQKTVGPSLKAWGNGMLLHQEGTIGPNKIMKGVQKIWPEIGPRHPEK